MESENESRPLLRTISRSSKRNIFRRIPSEVAITGVILALFLLVVTLLLLLENLGSDDSKQELTLDSNLLASPLKYNKKSAFQPRLDEGTRKSKTTSSDKSLDKVRNWLDEWRKSYDVAYLKNSENDFEKKLLQKDLFEIPKDFPESYVSTDAPVLGNIKEFLKKRLVADDKLLEKFQESIANTAFGDIGLPGSPFKYNKKAFDKTWQVKKYPENGFNGYKWDNVDKGWKTFYPLDSPSNKENVHIENIPSETEYGSVNNVWKKFSEKGDKMMKEFDEFNECWKASENQLKSKNKKEKNLDNGFKKDSNINVAAPARCPFHNLGTPLMQSQATTEIQVNCALLAEQVRRDLGKCIDLSFLPKECKPVWRTKCFSTYKYRKIDGSCNNQIHLTWGKSGIPYVRMMAPEYGDGVSSIRSLKNGENLPNARLLSQKLYSTKMKLDSDASMLFLYFGLMIDHDMVETAINTESILCCDEQFQKFPQRRPKECLEIPVSNEDPFYGPRNVKCLSVVRSLPVHGECVGRREQLNTATSLLDGSVIYGSTIQKMKSLRSFSKGQLRSQYINKTPYMAPSESAGYNCGTPSEPYKCFEAGDSRVNMLVELTAMHTLWYREHNKLAEELRKINPKWTDETLFQEARRILIAELQHIAYKEFLPLLLGNEAMDFFQLSIVDSIYYDGYDDTIDPSIFNVFGAAAFRFGHSMVQDVIDLIGPDNKTEESVPLHETYFNPQILYHKGLDYLIRGSIYQQIHSVDSFISKEIREHLFQAAGKDFGHDLAAIGIQRGRDHGIPGYTKWRLACGLPEIKSWDNLKSVMNVKRAEQLKEVYQFVEDIDLIPGALAEEHVEGSLLGPTHLCIIGRQFKKTRKGDRLWFEIQEKRGSFTADQLKEIYKSNMARIVCDNSDNIQKIQKHPFRVASRKNPVINCEETSKIDLAKWKAMY